MAPLDDHAMSELRQTHPDYNFQRDEAIIQKLKDSQLPWCLSLLSNESYTIYRNFVRGSIPGGDWFVGKALSKPSADPVLQTLYLRPVRVTSTEFPSISTVLGLHILGRLASGRAGVAHGGLLATICDDCISTLLFMNEEAEAAADPSHVVMPPVTAELDVAYRAPVGTSEVVLSRTVLQRREGRKVYMVCTIENGNGRVFTEAKAIALSLEAGWKVNKAKQLMASKI